MNRPTKPLGRKAYGSIGHLPSSRLGPGDHAVPDGQARICTTKARDKRDRIIVQEKLDGSCCAVAKVDGVIHALGRAGYPATTSPYEQHHLFAVWVRERYALFDALLRDGERIVGEWMAQAHGTQYDVTHPGFAPFVAFDLMRKTTRAPVDAVEHRLRDSGLALPRTISDGPPLAIGDLRERLEPSGHGAEQVEGAVYRVERDGDVDFLAKWVRPGKADGIYLPDVSDSVVDEPVWHWRPTPTPPAPEVGA